MHAVDYLTFYQGINEYKSERVFWWDDEHITTGNNSWAIFNTNFLEMATSGMDLFINEAGSFDLYTVPTTVNNNTRAEKYSAVMDSIYDSLDPGSFANPYAMQEKTGSICIHL